MVARALTAAIRRVRRGGGPAQADADDKLQLKQRQAENEDARRTRGSRIMGVPQGMPAAGQEHERPWKSAAPSRLLSVSS